MSFLPAILLAVCAQVDAPPSLSAEPAQVFSGHSAAVYAVDSSPDGSLVATASFDGTVKLWRVADGAERIVFSGHKGKVMSVAFSPDGRSLVSGGEDKTVKLWDVPLDQGRPLAEQLSPVRAVALHEKSGRLVTAGADGSLRIWGLAGRKEERVLEPAAPGLRTLAVDRSGALVAAAGSDRIVRIWNLAPSARTKKKLSMEGTPLVRPGEKWRLWRGKTSPPAGWNARTFDASAWELLPSGFGYGTNPAELKTVTTRLDDMKQDRQLAGTPGYLSIFVRAKFNIPDPSLARKLILKVAFDDGFVAFLNGMEVVREGMRGAPPGFRQGASATVADAVEKRFDLTPHLSKLKAGENLLALQGHNVNTSSSDFVLSPSLFAVLPTSPETQDKPGPLKLAGSEGEIRGVDFSLDGSRLAAAGDDRMVRIWRLSDGQEIARLQGEAAGRDLVFIDNNTLAVAGADGVVAIWNISGAKILRSLAGHVGAVLAVDWLPVGRKLASAGKDGTVRLWDSDRGKELYKLVGHEGDALSLSFSGNGKQLVSGGADKTLRVWAVESGKALGQFSHSMPVRAVAAAPGGQYYAAAQGNSLVAWKRPSSSAVKTLTGHGGFVHAVSFSPDGGMIASAGQDKSIRTWSAADGAERLTIKAHDSTIYALAFSPGGQQLCSGSFDKTIKLWNAMNGIEVGRFLGHKEGVFCLSFSADGQHLFSGSSDLTVRRWEVKNGKELSVYEGHGGWVTGLGLRPSGTQLISADYSGTLLTWNIADGRILARRRARPVIYGLTVFADGKKLVTANPENTALLLSQ